MCDAVLVGVSCLVARVVVVSTDGTCCGAQLSLPLLAGMIQGQDQSVVQHALRSCQSRSS